MKRSRPIVVVAFVALGCNATATPEVGDGDSGSDVSDSAVAPNDASNDASDGDIPDVLREVSTSCNPSGTHTIGEAGGCPATSVYPGAPCTDRCLSCNLRSDDGGPVGASGGPCVCTGTVWTCPSDEGCRWDYVPSPTCP